ncbi:MAG TPA: M67 family peptidase, partial [Rhodospirillales bacterium]|nr:M67 family peptidase [Rhodospirillales bacterium]
CGLLAGTGHINGDIAVTRMEPSANLADVSRSDRFEIDPEMRFRLMREIGEFDRLERDQVDPGQEHIVGHYHSHPDHPARPSATDLEMAFEPDLLWLIVAIAGGVVGETTVHRLDNTGRAFEKIPFRAMTGQEP